MGDVSDHAGQAEQNGEQEESMNNTGQTVSPACPDIDGGPHERTGTGNSAEQGSGHVAHTLSDKLPIAVVMRSGDVVCDQRRRKGVYRAQEGKLKGSGDDEFGIGEIETRHDEVRQAGRYVTNRWCRDPKDSGDDR